MNRLFVASVEFKNGDSDNLAGRQGFGAYEAAFRDAGFIEPRTKRNDTVRFGSHYMLGRKPATK